MNAMEKVAWLELSVSLLALIVVSALLPWLGNGAAGAFGLLGFLGAGVLFLRQRGPSVVVDERDQQIQQRSTFLGIYTAWMALFMALIGLVLWSSTNNEGVVSTLWLTWLIWVQFALCYAVKGLVGVLAYRSQRLAA